MASLLGAGCVGRIGGDTSSADGPTKETLSEIGPSGLRRLTAVEYEDTVADLLGVDPKDAVQYLPEDLRTPFDNDFTIQTASEALIDAAELLAGEIADEVVADPALRAKIVPCEPAGPDDAACYRQFLTAFGRRALRRSLSSDEIDRFAALLEYAKQAGDFWVGVDSALRAFLQHTQFLYRVEIGTPAGDDPAVFRLSDTELVTRLSYLLWGISPSGWLLDAAEDGTMATRDGVRSVVSKMLDDDHAKERIARFHAMWLSYETMSHSPELNTDMRLETDTLLARVIFEDRRPWADLLRSDETYLTPALATHYALPQPPGGVAGWVPYGDSGRRGILSHGTFLSAVPKFNDTSPTQRGLLIRTRLFCQVINKPPASLKVNTDMPPQVADPNACKKERYFMSHTDGCKMCHALMDPVGFGLENYDSAGVYRTYEKDRPDCPIDGDGALDPIGNFNGPAELGELMIKAGGVDQCVATELYRFAMGRFHLEEHDEALLDRLVKALTDQTELRLDEAVVELVTSDAFRYRREEAAK